MTQPDPRECDHELEPLAMSDIVVCALCGYYWMPDEDPRDDTQGLRADQHCTE